MIRTARTAVFPAAFAVAAQAATVYHLTNDFSNINNPNGVWSFRQGSTVTGESNSDFLTGARSRPDRFHGLDLVRTPERRGRSNGFNLTLAGNSLANSVVSNSVDFSRNAQGTYSVQAPSVAAGEVVMLAVHKSTGQAFGSLDGATRNRLPLPCL
jgi:hypothetical protein